jgi:Kdo2-lipid IVA lauroyltransferase/acyltransferase
MINEINYFLLKIFVFCIEHIPRSIGLKIFGFIGYIWYLLDGKRKKKAFKNITTKLDKNISKSDANKLIRKNFAHFCQSMFELLWSSRINIDDADHWFEVEGKEILDKVKQSKKGTFFITSHFGIWELLIPFLEKEGVAWHSVYQPIKPAIFDRFMKEKRLRFKTGNLFPINKALEGIMGAFKNNETVALVIDKRVKAEKGVVVNFFGSRIIVNKNIAKLAMQSKVPVIPFFLVRQEKDYRVIFLPEVEVENTGDEINDIEKTTQKFITVIEKMIRRYPEQFPWFYNRWKPRPYSRLLK